jgi:pantoate--beta-alanine ligase
MEEIEDTPTLRAALMKARCAGHSIGLVPTMGYLHDGHMRLVSKARADNDVVVASIFVNPTQFGPTEDLQRYPRDLDRDRARARGAGVDVLFVPDVQTMYPDGPDHQEIWIEPGSLAAHLDGAGRPLHFRGVATVVTKLFNLVQPHRAYFGQKDGQQALIVQRLVRALAYDIAIVIVPTARDADNLALSSRNVYLSEEERKHATAIPRALALARALILAGQRDSREIVEGMQELIEREAPHARVDFIEIAATATISPVSTIDGDAMIALAVYFGGTRLIDNTIVRFVAGQPHFE